MRPGGLPDGLQDHVDPFRQPGPGTEDLIGAELESPLALGLAAAGRPHPVAGRAAEHDERGGHPAARALYEQGRARLDARLLEQHLVRGQVGRRQARRLLERQRRRLRHQVAPRDADPLGEDAVVPFGEQRATRIEGLVAAPRIGVADDRVHHDLVTVRVDPRRVAAEHDRQPVRRDTYPAQRPDVVVVECRRLHRHRHPPVRGGRLRTFAELESGQRVISVDTRSGGSKHDPHPTDPAATARWPPPALPRSPPSPAALAAQPRRARPRYQMNVALYAIEPYECHIR